MTNNYIWQRANGRAAMVGFWALAALYTHLKYFT